MLNRKISILLVAAVLVVAILLPILYTGYSSIKRADAELAAQEYANAAVHYQQAARLLPWRTDLLEKGGHRRICK
ncbi:MAG: hypothetical protein IPO22_15915 [Anaerolineales bacterium]|nr:hypothetical protein [Anaerolineales bacterium]